MHRRVRLSTVELGWVELAVLVSSDSRWPSFWEPLRSHPIGSLFSTVSKNVFDHALHGWTSPLVHALGLPPTGALHKIPVHSCALRMTCPHHDASRCLTTHEQAPTCFEASVGVDGDPLRLAATEAIRLWRDGLYIVVVDEGKRGYNVG